MHFDDFHEVIDKHRKTDEQDLNFSVGDKYPDIIIESITLNAIYILSLQMKNVILIICTY